MGWKKEELRREIKEKKKRIRPEQKREWDQAICRQIMGHPRVREAECVYAYASLPGEADTWEILSNLWRLGKRAALPRVEGKEILFYYVKSLAELSRGSFQILEPSDGLPAAGEKNALLLVPGTAFTADGRRLGKGGGYYDRFLRREPDHWTIGLAYDFQMVPDMETESFDRRVCEIVTPSEHFYQRQRKKGK